MKKPKTAREAAAVESKENLPGSWLGRISKLRTASVWLEASVGEVSESKEASRHWWPAWLLLDSLWQTSVTRCHKPPTTPTTAHGQITAAAYALKVPTHTRIQYSTSLMSLMCPCALTKTHTGAFLWSDPSILQNSWQVTAQYNPITRIYVWICGNFTGFHVAKVWLDVGITRTWLRLGKISFLGLKCLFWSPQTRLETSQGLVNNAWYRHRKQGARCPDLPSKSIRNTAGNCPTVSWQMLTCGLKLRSLAWQPFSSVTPPPSSPSPHTKARS